LRDSGDDEIAGSALAACLLTLSSPPSWTQNRL